MAFDVEGALKAGYSLDEIAKEAGFDIASARQAGYSDQEIIGELVKTKYPKWDVLQQQSGSLPPIGPRVTGLPQDIQEPVREAIGGIVGGLAGTVLGPVGSIAGAGAGYAAERQRIRTEKESAGLLPTETIEETWQRVNKDVRTGAAMEATGQLFMKPLAWAAKWLGSKAKTLYESALKIPPSVPNEVRNKAIATGIEGKFVPSQKGLDQLQSKIDLINRDIQNVVDQAAVGGGQVDTGRVIQRIDQLRDFYQNAPIPDKYLKQLDEISADLLAARGQTIPADTAQRIKQTVYALNKKHYGEMKGLEIEANKAIARGIKEELASMYPQLKTLNAEDSALINLEEVLERAVNRTRNYDIIRIGDTIMTTTGAVLGGPGGAGAALMFKHILEAPVVKSRLAFALAKAGTQEFPLTSRALAYGSKIAHNSKGGQK